MRKRFAIEEDQARFNRQLIRGHLIAQGQSAPADGVRATMVKLANGLAQGYPGVRPELAQLLVDRLNQGATPRVRMLGSVGQADLSANADLVDGLLDDFELAAGEALVLVDNNAFSTGLAALAVSDYETLLDALDVAGALDLEAFAANPGLVHEAVADARPHPGVRSTIARLRALLEGSYLWDAQPRNLQDPLTFRTLPQVNGAARDALTYAQGVLAVELNAHQGNPMVAASVGRVVAAGELRHRPPRGGARLLAHRLGPGVDERSRASAQALAVSAHGPAGGACCAAAPRRTRAQRARCGGAGDRRGGTPARPARLVRARVHDAARGHRGPHDDGSARRPPACGDGEPGRSGRGHRADDCSSGRRSARISRRSASERLVPTSSSASAFPSRTRARRCRPTSSRSSSWFVLT